jgi:hypothetical protein
MSKQGISIEGFISKPAHELGHGAFGLKHSFDPEYGISDNPQITKALNLMGYNDQHHLAKFQWDIIHDSKAGETTFDSTDQVMARRGDDDILKLFNDIRRINYNDSLDKIYDQYPLFPERHSVSNLKLGRDTLSELTIVTNTARPNTEEYVFINTEENLVKPCSECIDDSYAKLVFTDHHDEKHPVSTGLERISIIVKRTALTVLMRYLYTEKQTNEETILEGVTWVHQYDETLFGSESCWKEGCCYKASHKILEYSGASTDRNSQLVIAESTNSDCSSLMGKAVEFKEAIRIIDKSLKEHKLPIMVGVHHPIKKQNPETKITIWENNCSINVPNITNHYIVIVGKGYDKIKQQYYYLFYEVGISSPINGKSNENRLYISDNNSLMEGKTVYRTDYSGNYYVVTEVRKNRSQIY